MLCYVCGVRTFLAMIQLIECTTRERDSAHFRQSLLLLTLRGCDTRLSSFAACSLALVALRLSVRPSVRPSLSLSLSPSPSVIRRSTLAVAVATVARSSRIVAAARRRTPSLAPALLSLSAKSAEEGRRGRARAISLRPNVPRPTSRLGSRRVTERE